MYDAAVEKAMKEAFVSNHYGGSISEINEVTLVAPVSLSCCVVQESAI